MDIALIVDSSGSINTDHPMNWDIVKDFLVKLTHDIDAGLDRSDPDAKHRVAMVRFSSNAYIDWTLDDHSDQTSLTRAIQNLKYDGHETNTPEAFKKALQVFQVSCILHCLPSIVTHNSILFVIVFNNLITSNNVLNCLLKYKTYAHIN